MTGPAADSLNGEIDRLKKKVEALERHNKDYADQIDSFKRKRIWGKLIAAVVIIFSAVMMSSFGWGAIVNKVNAEQASVLIAIIVGWCVMVGTFSYIFGRNDDTWL